MPLDIDRFSHVESMLRRWDPRVKLFSLGFFIIGVALLKTLPLAFVALGIAVIVIKLSGLPFHFIFHGIKWIVLFLLPFFFILPLSFPGEAVVSLWGITFVWEGLRMACLIFVKAFAIVLITFSAFGTARFDVSMVALQHLKCPLIVTQMLLFTYRYTFVFLEEMRRMQMAMRIRGFVLKSDLYTLQVMGNFVGTLLVRSFERTERIYKAMLSKGYQGEFHTLVRFQVHYQDYAKGLLMVLLTLVLVGCDLSGLFLPAVQGWH